MDTHINVHPLPYTNRRNTFGFLVVVFLVSLPLLYLYAIGYRFDFDRPTNLISTGGIYVAVEQTGAEIFIDNELVRETRTFRKAFYAQNLDVGTHRISVQKEGYHTWVKELPVSKRLVTEAAAFNFKLAPEVRVISMWKTATGTTVVREDLKNASSTNPLTATTTLNTKRFVLDTEYEALLKNFVTMATSTPKEGVREQIKDLLLTQATTTQAVENATTTITSGGVKLYQRDADVYATWIGPFEQMPYYYCAADFPRYSDGSATTTESLPEVDEVEEVVDEVIPEGVMHPIQTVSKDDVCDPTIRIDRKWQEVQDFQFFPGSTDLVIMVLKEGVYAVEVDDRSWQNTQSLFMGTDLRLYIENGNIYVYDGTLIYQIIVKAE